MRTPAVRAALAVWLLLVPAAAARALEVLSIRALDEGPRTSIMVLVRNESDRPATIRDLRLGGQPIRDQMTWIDTRPRLGQHVDWFDIRPKTIPAGEAGVIMLGHVTRDLREPRLRLQAATGDQNPSQRGQGDAGRPQSVEASRGLGIGGKTWDLSGPVPPPERLAVAAAVLDDSLRQLTLVLLNGSDRPLILQRICINGRPVPMQLRAPTMRPGMPGMATATLPGPVAQGADCNLLVTALGLTGPVKATAWFRAFPAQSLTYIFGGNLADSRDLAEKQIDIPRQYHEAGAGVGREIDAHQDQIPLPLAERMGRRAAAFGADPQAWGWYMQDDAAFGTPRPQAIVELGHFLREHGSPQRQVLCNPADNRRYAWVSDTYLNYWYHATHEGSDPAVFPGDRSPALTRSLNQPAPVVYVVDAVGQKSRWITPVEEELANYAMIGRGVVFPGWFMATSLWDQGGDKHGGPDRLETMPWRYQEGVVACKQVWDHVGRIAGMFRLLARHLAASVPMPGEFRDDRIEVLPVYCHTDLVIATLLNRRVRCTYPRDYPNHTGSGAVRLAPVRNLAVEVPIPAWIKPAAVLAVDHERGLRDLPFQAGDGQITVQVDAVDAVTTLLVCPDKSLAEILRKDWNGLSATSPGGSPIRPSLVIDATAADPWATNSRPWTVSERRYRAALVLHGPIEAGRWLQTELPIEGPASQSPIGFFDPATVTAVDAAGNKVQSLVDFYRPLYEAYEQTPLWGLGGGNGPGPMHDEHARLESDLRGLTVRAEYARENPAQSGTLRFLGHFDPQYEVLEIRRQGTGRIVPVLTFGRTVDGQPQHGILAIRSEQFDGLTEPDSRLIAMPGGQPPLLQLRWLDLIRQAERQRADKTGRPSVFLSQPPETVALRFLLYEATYRIEQIRQRRTRPLVYLCLPEAIEAGQTATLDVYWDYAIQPPVDCLAINPAQRPATAVALQSESREAFALEAVQRTIQPGVLARLQVVSQAAAATAWVEARDENGSLREERLLRSQDSLTWQLAEPLPLAAAVRSLRAVVADDFGQVIAVDLLRPDPPPVLESIARVGGQVETLACPAGGQWVLAGADKVYAFAADGKARWSVDLGSNPRQPPHFGPGRNVEQVAVRSDARAAFARSFRWNEATRQYEASLIRLLSPEGRRIAEVACRWSDGAGFAPDGTIQAVVERDGRPLPVSIDPASGEVRPRAASPRSAGYALGTRRTPGAPPASVLLRDGREQFAVDWPPYTLHRLLCKDGRVLAATTQGRIMLWAADGKIAWQCRRPSRIDDARLLESRGLLAIAYKSYPHRWDWYAEPVLELIDLADGRRRWLGHGPGFDDFGHYGTHLVMAVAEEGGRIFLGDPAGRIMACHPRW